MEEVDHRECGVMTWHVTATCLLNVREIGNQGHVGTLSRSLSDQMDALN